MNIESISPEYYTLKEFKFNNGKVLENQTVEYMTMGTPQYDDEGHITNAIIACLCIPFPACSYHFLYNL